MNNDVFCHILSTLTPPLRWFVATFSKSHSVSGQMQCGEANVHCTLARHKLVSRKKAVTLKKNKNTVAWITKHCFYYLYFLFTKFHFSYAQANLCILLVLNLAASCVDLPLCLLAIEKSRFWLLTKNTVANVPKLAAVKENWLAQKQAALSVIGKV